MENPTIEKIAAIIYSERLFHAAQYRRVEKAMRAYNTGLASRFALYATQDEAIAEMLVAPATDFETVQHLALVQAVVIPIEAHQGPDMPPPNYAIELLNCVAAVEETGIKNVKWFLDHYNARYQKIVEFLSEIVSFQGLINISFGRIRECERMVRAIESGTLFYREKKSPFFCTRCGTKHASKEVFATCKTCNAPMTYCALPFEFL